MSLEGKLQTRLKLVTLLFREIDRGECIVWAKSWLMNSGDSSVSSLDALMILQMAAAGKR